MAAPSTLTLFNSFGEYIADGTIDLNTDTIVATLHTSAYTPLATHTVAADLTNELANGNGYTTGGLTLTGVLWTRSLKVSTFDADDLIWTASGAGLSGIRTLVLRKNGTANSRVNPLIGYTVLDSAPADLPAISAPNQLQVKWNASGIFTFTTP